MEKKQQQLGMNPSTASGRLVRDILYKLVCTSNLNACFHCGKEMARSTFSIEHMIPWLDSENPIGLFFDLDNIAFSHHSCNVKAGRKPTQKYFSKEEKRRVKNIYYKNRKLSMPIEQRQEIRRQQYKRTGK